ncbi:isopenicillin N synthase family dioxygenase [Celeribacter indicus]|uniref:2-oxoglutarate-dependent ethylene/succinate-forming enzyme n=1 Tax=Celeribacter indicus TaxID=1208324 RepID=A0A0B5E158_9RHOB|nr:2OG-Fe(II) oxygenase family protein [Celeribacter indicus]AJE46746.1 2OG-Fe(II) oxygenase [Celeribacter indicus]SDX05448.1 Isopenicillin N synthase [Celeribacter indicus]
MTHIEIEVVDIGPFHTDDADARLATARAFGRSMERTGFAVITGHRVPETLAEDLHASLRTFFALPFDQKSALMPPEKVKGRGYLPMGIESVAKTLDGETPPDLCEALVFSAPHRELRGEHSRNDWPGAPTELTPLIRQWTQEMERLTRVLARISSLALDLPEDYLDAAYADPSLTLRFVNYPDQPDPPAPGQLRYGAHHDYGGLTVLRQDTAPGGLEIRDTDGIWREARTIPGSFVINVGDLMSRWTNGRWRSTLHRVTNPDRVVTGSTQRLSLVAFTNPHETWEIAPLPSCVSDERPAAHPPVRAGDFIREKIRTSMDLTVTR